MKDSFFHRAVFFVRHKFLGELGRILRTSYFGFLGLQTGKNSRLGTMRVTWPHQVMIGDNCKLEDNIFFKYDGIWKPGPSIVIGDRVFIGADCEFNIRLRIEIGNDGLIASGCKFIDHDHGILEGQLIRAQRGNGKEINIGNDVWLGCNVVVLKGVDIGEGVVVAAGAVVTRSIPAGEIWGGVPARKIGMRKRESEHI